jgi:hypothetical protein
MVGFVLGQPHRALQSPLHEALTLAARARTRETSVNFMVLSDCWKVVLDLGM